MKIAIKRFKTSYNISYTLLLITPLVDTVNGMYLIINGATGLSLGTFYRIILLSYFIFHGIGNKRFFQYILAVIPILLLGIVKGAEYDELVGCVTYAFKWILPIVLICYFSFVFQNKRDIFNCLQRCINIWSWYIPVSLLIEYKFDIGYNTYYDAGFRGLYYSINDIAFVLISLYIYVAYKLFQKISIARVFQLAILLVSIFILGVKSCIIFSIITICYFIVTHRKIKKKNLLYIVLIIIGSIFLLEIAMRDEIVNIVNRYTNMWVYSQKNNFWDQFFVFATSARIDRIAPFFLQLNTDHLFLIGVLFGWIIPDNAHTIEMDFHDLICQYGIIGFLCIILIYISLLMKCRKKIQPYWFMLIVGAVYAFLAGHVISGALSGTIFATNFSMLLLLNIKKTREISGKESL